MPETANASASMDKALAALRAQLAEARVTVNAGFSFGTAADLQAQYNGQLDQAQRWIDRLDTDLRARVQDGTWDASNWLAIAQQQSDLIASTMGESAGGPDLSSFWSQVVGQSASDLSNKVQVAAGALGDALPWYFVGGIVALLALAVIRVGRP